MELCKSDCGNYSIELLSAATIPGALKVINDDFFSDEAVCIGTEVNINPVACEELLELCADAVLDGVSVAAVEISTGEVVAVCFNKIQVSASNQSEKPFFEIFAEERCSQPSSKELVQFMVELDEQCNLFEKYGVDCSMELMFLGTRREHRRKHLAYLLCKVSIDIARKLKNGPVSKITIQDLGPQYSDMKPRAVPNQVPKICQILGTSIGTQKIIKALGFTVHLRVPLKDYTYNGKSYVERIGHDPFCEGAARSLD